jgi:hypothetical protein
MQPETPCPCCRQEFTDLETLRKERKIKWGVDRAFNPSVVSFSPPDQQTAVNDNDGTAAAAVEETAESASAVSIPAGNSRAEDETQYFHIHEN